MTATTLILGWADYVTPAAAFLLGCSLILFVGTLLLARRAARVGRSGEVLIAGALISLLPLVLLAMMLVDVYV
ncbi:hypothetical protein HED60_24300 [Planctomycetales bacterium ZRK34]|nr:hypothetical protein HED60_24300 [Planctomycetales bacterium ZRK34]